jgi:REP-associated tyrosine transposase
MPDYIRAKTTSGTFFFTVITHQRRPILTTELARNCLRMAFQKTQEAQPFQQHALCILPNHLHCIWTLPENDDDFSSRWRRLKSTFSRTYRKGGGAEASLSDSRRRKGEAGIWQRRFWEHWIRDNDDYERHLDYTHYNPVKHGHVQKPIDWPWSSFHRHVRAGEYDAGWGVEEPRRIRNMEEAGE